MCLLPWLQALSKLAAAYTACLSLSAAHEPESVDHALFLDVPGAWCCTCRRWEAGPDVAVAPRLPQLMLLMPDMLGPSMALAFLFPGASAPCAQLLQLAYSRCCLEDLSKSCRHIVLGVGSCVWHSTAEERRMGGLPWVCWSSGTQGAAALPL